MTFTPDVPGRGAWTLKGGLLKVSPTSTSTRGYYRLAVGNEKQIGSMYVTNVNRTDTYASVWYGVKAIQTLCNAVNTHDIEVDGWFGEDTDVAVRKAQAEVGVVVDGIVGRDTMRGLITPLLVAIRTARGVPISILGGIAVNESGLDPAAVGVNGWDHGLVQINLQAHPSVSESLAMLPSYALDFAGASLRKVYNDWVGKTTADPWDIAIAYHNNPSLAVQWAKTGVPPVVEGRTIQIEEYVRRTRAAW